MEVTPQEHVLDRTQEQIVGVPVPRIMEERVQHRTQEQIADSPVPQIMEAVLLCFPQELVKYRTPEQIVDFPVPQIMEAPVDFLASFTAGARAISYVRTDCGAPCASDR